MRTIASAAEICKELGISKADINYQLSEYLNVNVYSEDPFPKLEYKKYSPSELDEEYNLQGVEFNEIKGTDD